MIQIEEIGEAELNIVKQVVNDRLKDVIKNEIALATERKLTKFSSRKR